MLPLSRDSDTRTPCPFPRAPHLPPGKGHGHPAHVGLQQGAQLQLALFQNCQTGTSKDLPLDTTMAGSKTVMEPDLPSPPKDSCTARCQPQQQDWHPQTLGGPALLAQGLATT